jgi:putative transposase
VCCHAAGDFSCAVSAGVGRRSSQRVAKVVDDADVLEFYDYPAERWIHLTTTNLIESTFATVRLRTKLTKGPGSRATGIAMAYKLIDAARARWRAMNAPHLVALVRGLPQGQATRAARRHHTVDITPSATLPEPTKSTDLVSPKVR